jgi:hypothetical protein
MGVSPAETHVAWESAHGAAEPPTTALCNHPHDFDTTDSSIPPEMGHAMEVEGHEHEDNGDGDWNHDDYELDVEDPSDAIHTLSDFIRMQQLPVDVVEHTQPHRHNHQQQLPVDVVEHTQPHRHNHQQQLPVDVVEHTQPHRHNLQDDACCNSASQVRKKQTKLLTNRSIIVNKAKPRS